LQNLQKTRRVGSISEVLACCRRNGAGFRRLQIRRHDSHKQCRAESCARHHLDIPIDRSAGSRDLTLTVDGYSFISGSVLQWGGSVKSTTFVSSTRLTAVMPAAILRPPDCKCQRIHPCSWRGLIRRVELQRYLGFPALPPYGTTARRGGRQGVPVLAASQRRLQPYSWSLSSGSLPDNLSLSAGGVISGVPSAVSGNTPYSFAIEVKDYAYQPNTVTQLFRILLRAGKLGRNDTCSAATPISNGVIRASLSPYGDIDVYSFQGTAGAGVTRKSMLNA